jgi:hypothetical protein
MIIYLNAIQPVNEHMPVLALTWPINYRQLPNVHIMDRGELNSDS